MIMQAVLEQKEHDPPFFKGIWGSGFGSHLEMDGGHGCCMLPILIQILGAKGIVEEGGWVVVFSANI